MRASQNQLARISRTHIQTQTYRNRSTTGGIASNLTTANSGVGAPPKKQTNWSRPPSSLSLSLPISPPTSSDAYPQAHTQIHVHPVVIILSLSLSFCARVLVYIYSVLYTRRVLEKAPRRQRHTYARARGFQRLISKSVPWIPIQIN